MSTRLSVDQVIANLEKRLAFHQEHQAAHARQEALHREQRELHEAEIEKLRQGLESFRGLIPVVDELGKPLPEPLPASSMPTGDDLPSGRLLASRLVRLIVQSPGFTEPFGPTSVAAEINRRFAHRLKKPVDRRMVSNVLRRLLAEGLIEIAREGKAFQEAQYVRRRS